MKTQKNIIVIGSGFGGLSAAIRLASAGHQVILYEKRDKLGGRAYQYEFNGFKFDGGPTVITAPYLFDELFSLGERNREDYFKLMPVDPFYKIFDEKGRYYHYYRDLDCARKEVARISPDDVEGFERFKKSSVDIFHKYHPLTEKPFLKVKEMLDIIPGALKMGTYLPTYQYASRFVKDEFLRRVCSFHPLLIGGSPFDTPSIFNLIIQFEKEWGIHYAEGGTGAIVYALGQLFEEMGGKIELNTEISEIVIESGKATGVRLKDGRFHEADEVVCNADVAFAYKNMIAKKHRPRKLDLYIDKMAYSNSLVVIYFGTKRRYLDSQLSHHNIIFNGQYRQLLRNIFRSKPLSDELCLYLHMPTYTDTSIAPQGCESFYVLSLVPHLDADIDWEEKSPEYNDHILRFLEKNYLPDLRKNIIAQHSINPVHFKDTLNSYKGAAFSVKPSLIQSGWMRPHTRSTFYENLYFVGAGTHPGAGVPAVIASGKIAAEMIDPEAGRTPHLIRSEKVNTTLG